MTAEWYYQLDGAKVGPMTASDLKRHADAGRISADTPILNSTKDKWYRASKVRGLLDATLVEDDVLPERELTPIATEIVFPSVSPSLQRIKKSPTTISNGELWEFSIALDQAFSCAQKAIRDLGYKVDLLDKPNGLLNFKTGMSWSSWAGQEMSVMIIDNGDGTVEVSVTGRRNQNGVVLQVYDWGEAKGIAGKLLAKMAEYL